MPAATTNNPAGSGYALFDTAIGRCTLVWRGGLVVGAALPESSDERARASIARRFPGAVEAKPPPFAAAAIARIVGLLDGAKTDLGDIPVDAEGSAFERNVWQSARRIPCGEVRTYGDIARDIGAPGAAQAVGIALGRNPAPIIIPCHRVLAADGRSGGFSAPGGVATKFRILEIEGARRPGEPELFESLPLAVRPAGT
ncbi:MAG TPA: methylated-DNA--[protein]-cysteine S-methyltransferase [Allosphingosinicella sp.]|jgi:methylated-DNA-[protein]-cysteine S-methyltransferase|nr:methylated-DNA--[protein]-cysteine S-methyltransferase [Allosphingosinicella sp.]